MHGRSGRFGRPAAGVDGDLELTPREVRVALVYFGLYLAYLFATVESELLHWLTLVLVPIGIAASLGPPGRRTPAGTLASFGLRRGHLTQGLWWAVGLGVGLSALQILASGRAEEIQELIASGRALVLLPLSLGLMLVLAGFTEEFFFRGFLQTRLEPLVRSRWLAVLVASLLFGVYHLPYAYLNPMWASAGDWGAAWSAALVNGVPGGLLLGTMYVISGRNLLSCVLLHSLIMVFPAMTMIRFSGA